MYRDIDGFVLTAETDCREASSRRRAEAAEEQSERCSKAQQQAEQERRLAQKEKEERISECLSWREKHQTLADIFRAQEDLKSQRQNKAVSATQPFKSLMGKPSYNIGSIAEC